MKIAHTIINIVLPFFIILSAVTFVTAYSLDTQKLATAAEDAGVNTAIASVASKQLTSQVATNLGVAPEQLPPEYANLISEQYVGTKTDQLFNQLQAYLDGKGNGIVLDLSDIASTATAQGITLDAPQLQPVVIAPAPSSSGQPNSFINPDVTKWVLYSVTVLLFVISVILSVIRRSFKGLGVAVLVSAGIVGLFSLIGKIIDATLISRITFNGDLAQLTQPVRMFAGTIISNMNTLYFYQFLILLVTGGVCFIIHKFIQTSSIAPTKNSVADKQR